MVLRKEGGPSIAEQVSTYLEKYPYLIWTLKNGLMNYSSLARRIQQELGVKNFDAVIMAARRYSETIRLAKDAEIIGILSESTLEIKTGMNVYVLKDVKKEVTDRLGHYHLISGTDFNVLITQTKLTSACIKKHENVVEVRIRSPEAIGITAGFVAYVYGVIAERGINLIETYSVYTDTVFVIDKRNLPEIVETFERIGIK